MIVPDQVFVLRRGPVTVSVSPYGGSILGASYGDLHFMGPPSREIISGESKTRGISHWCQPFGRPSVNSKWLPAAPHGLLRQTRLTGGQVSDWGARLSGYVDGFLYETEVEINDEGILTFLYLENYWKEAAPILPALHPYFSVFGPGLVQVFMDQQLVAAASSFGGDFDHWALEHSRIVGSAGSAKVVIGDDDLTVEIEMSAHGLERRFYVLWSDLPKKYLCIEPLFGLPADYCTPAGLWLPAGESRRFAVLFRLIPKKK